MPSARLETMERRHATVFAKDVERLTPMEKTARSHMAAIAIAYVPTNSGSRYLQQLCKHWAHNLPVEFTANQGTIIFSRSTRGADWPGDAVVKMIAHAKMLECLINATAEGQRDGLKKAIARHLDRFAFREAPLSFDWTDG
jgi:hypothetical protein